MPPRYHPRVLALWIVLGVLAVLVILWWFRPPKCPKCRKRGWRRVTAREWRCLNCDQGYDPLTAKPI